MASGELAREVLTKHNKGYKGDFSFSRTPTIAKATRESIGPSLTGMVGEDWRWRKEELSNVFTMRSLQDPQRRILDYVLRLADEMRETLGNGADSAQPVAFADLFMDKAVRTIMFMMFGRELKFDPLEFGEATSKIMAYFAFNLFTPPLLRSLPLPSFRKQKRQLLEGWDTFDTVVLPEIRRIRKELSEERVEVERAPGSMVHHMLRGKWLELDDEAVAAECRVLINAGFETTAWSLCFGCGLFAENPETANLVAKEVAELHSGAWKELPVEKVQALMEGLPLGAFQESLRLYPLAAALGGIAVRPFELGGYQIPKGANVGFLNDAIHRHPVEVGPDAEEFLPQRWVAREGEARATRPLPVLMSFNLGAHACLGQHLARLEGAVFLAAAARDFKMTFPPDGPHKVELGPDTFLQRPKGRMSLLVERRPKQGDN